MENRPQKDNTPFYAWMIPHKEAEGLMLTLVNDNEVGHEYINAFAHLNWKKVKIEVYE
jgi:hypothetical protein